MSVGAAAGRERQDQARPDHPVASGEGVTCRIALPKNFRAGDVLAFHRRDRQALAEQVEGRAIRKGIAWNGQPACLTVSFGDGDARVELAVDGDPGAAADVALRRLVRLMLGLTQNVEAFEDAWREHPEIGPLIAERPGLRVSLSATPFEALTWAITGQQISVRAAISVRRRLIGMAGLRHSSGIACYPDAARLLEIGEADLRTAGLSGTKAATLVRLSNLVVAGELPLDEWAVTLPVDEIRERLRQVRGIGPWTINYALLRGFGWLDGSLHGDVAVRRSLQTILGATERVGEADAQRWLAQFSPWRALVAAHLWAMQRFDA